MKQLIVFSVKKKNQASLLCKLFYLTCVVERAWYGMENFSMFHTGNFFSFYFHSTLKIFHSIFHPILKFSFIFHSILPYQRNFRLEAMQHIFCCFASLQCCKQPLVTVRQQYKDAKTNIWYVYCTWCNPCVSQDFGLGGGLNCKTTFNDVFRNFQKERLFMGQRMKNQMLGVRFST